MEWIKKNRLFAILVFAAALVALVAAVSRKSEIPVRSETVKRESIQATITTNGKVEPVNNFEAHALAASAVKRVLVKEGQQVKAGQLLVQLDDADARAAAARAQAQIRAAQADVAAVRHGGTQEEVLTNASTAAKAKTELEAAQRNLTAVQKLKEEGSASQGELDEAQSRLHRAQADYDLVQKRQTGRYSQPEVARAQSGLAEARAAYIAAQEQLKNANITAPRAGTVYSLPVKAGAFVNPGDLIVQVADLRKVEVRAFVDEPEIGKLSRGQSVAITWDAVPGRTWQGTVSSVPTTVVMRGTRNVGEVITAVDNSDQKLLPNVNVNVVVTTARADNALAVSREAVLSSEGKRYLYVIHDGKLQRTDIETGASNLTRIQLLKGASEGTEVAVGSVNGQPLSEGAPVKIVKQ